MNEGMGQRNPWDEDMKILGEACRSLAKLDADRLEELAKSCRRLHANFSPGNRQQNVPSTCCAAVKEAKVLDRILGKTRENIEVIRRIEARSAGANKFDCCGQEDRR